MPVEDLDLNYPHDPIKTDQTKPTSSDQINKIEVRTGSLDDASTPGETDAEFIHRLVGTPDEKLIPWEECFLPSQGLYYGWPDGMVQVRAMGQTAEKILATARLSQTGQSMDYLFRECCRFPLGFDPLDLLLGDRIFMLYFLRGITHGNLYEFAVTCPNQACAAVTTHTYDLNELSQTIVWAKKELGPEPFKVVLPYMSAAAKREVWVGVRFLRASDANDMLAKRKSRKRMLAQPGGVRTNPNRANPFERARTNSTQTQQIDDTISDNLERIIVDVNGVKDLFVIREFVKKMHAQDTATVREWLRENTPGIDNTVTVDCPECSQPFTIELPITESFFRPVKPGGVRT